MLSTYGGHWDLWSLNHKVTFDGELKLVIVNPGVTYLDVKTDLYSSWKEWLTHLDYLKYEPAMRVVGGDPTVSGNSLGATYFMTNGWRIRTWEGDHRLIVYGNLYTEEGTDPFVPTLLPHNITISMTVSNIVDKMDESKIAKSVWNANSPDFVITGTKGKELQDALKALKVLLANSL